LEKKSYAICLLILGALGSLTIYPKSINGSLQDQIYPPNSSPYGLSHKNWGIALWDWWMSIPKEIAPSPDPTKYTYDCFIGLGYPVVMLANPIIADIPSHTVTYNCDVPADRAILVFGITEWCNYDATHKTDEDLRKCVVARNDFAKHQILIDGKNVENVEQYRVTTDFYNMTFPKDNMYSVPAGTFRSLLDGTWLMLKPLPVGDHKIEVHIVQIIPGREADNLFLNLIYNLHVTDPSLVK
jgi:hypothetical protein